MSDAEKNSFIIRKPTVKDVPQMLRIVNGYAAQSQMLPRSQHQIYQWLRDFVIATTAEGEIIGCGAVHVVWEDLCEIRSLAVLPEWMGRGVGKAMVEALITEAQSLGLIQVFALTYRQGFFERMGFHVVPRESLPHKMWGDCLDCPKFPNCDEIAMARNL